MENMIMPCIVACFFYGQKIAWLFHHTDQAGIPFMIPTDGTWVTLGKGETAGTKLYGTVELAQGGGKFMGFCGRTPEDVECQPGCGYFPDSRKFCQILN